jgi:hypothetical protein
MLASGCIRFPVLAVDVPLSIPFQQFSDHPPAAALLRSSKAHGARHTNFSAEELEQYSHELLVGRVYRVTLNGSLSSSLRRFHFATQHMYAFFSWPFVAFFEASNLSLCCRLVVRNEIPFAYLVQHDGCSDTSSLMHEHSVVLQVQRHAPVPQYQSSRFIACLLCCAISLGSVLFLIKC